MTDDPVTLEEAKRERNVKEHAEEHEEYQPSFEVQEDANIEDLRELFEDIRSFLMATPDDLRERTLDEGIDRDRTIIAQLANAGNIEAVLDTLDEDLTNLTQLQLLANIAMSNRAIAQVANVMLMTQIHQLDTLFSISEAVEPYTGVTVSGTNVIEDEGEPQPVVPDSDEVSIPTKLLLLKAGDDNKGVITIGDDNVSPTSGWILHSGEGQAISWRLREGILWMAGDNEGDVIELLGVV